MNEDEWRTRWSSLIYAICLPPASINMMCRCWFRPSRLSRVSPKSCGAFLCKWHPYHTNFRGSTTHTIVVLSGLPNPIWWLIIWFLAWISMDWFKGTSSGNHRFLPTNTGFFSGSNLPIFTNQLRNTTEVPTRHGHALAKQALPVAQRSNWDHGPKWMTDSHCRCSMSDSL